MNKEEILTTIDQMTVKELAELVEAIEERYKVSAQAVASVAVHGAPAAGGAPAGGAAVAEEKTAFKVVLKNAGQQKVQLIKVIKEITGKGLKESKALVDTLPAVVKEGLNEEEARSLKAKLEEVGAEIELQ
ncbi:MAG: 50S ribosomal protein L7/L12 [Candidatus Acetothermia bacterium]|jgi:large subunit ribosomal protein L7/L12|nr:50S ribosomal protein L7/L12 [Candidatus Acetothermia bacterium]MDH7504888.1 50S ribosomal protein L7/L12 [Candidatus Acetothermia bacterium]